MMLTDTEIRKAKPRSAMYRMSDGRSLYLAVMPTGGKLWRWKYRFEGSEKLMSFGNYPDVPLADARERHAEGRRILASGVDPMAQRKAEKVARTTSDARSFKTIALLWFDHWKVNKSERHISTNKGRLEMNVFPLLGTRAIDQIEAPDIVAVAKMIEARGAGDLAKRTMQTISQIFRYAVANGYTKRNPAADIKPRDILKPTTQVNLARIDIADLPKLLRDIEVYRGKVVTRFAMKVMMLCFPRTQEMIGGCWPEIDWETSRWTIPGERMKMGTPHIIPLCTQAIEVLQLLYAITGGGELMFPGDIDPRKPMSKNTVLEALYRMGYKNEMTGHGFRGLVSTALYENDFEEAHVELQLAHIKRNKVRAAYDHAKYLKQRAAMMQWWGDYVERALHGDRVLAFKTDAA